MKTLTQHIKEALEREELSFKIDTWLSSRPDEKSLWDNACKSWRDTRQIDDEAIRTFMSATDVRGFVDFLNDNIASAGIHSDDFDIIKKTIKNVIQ